MEQILLFGDSITQGSYDPTLGFGFGAALTHAYVRRLDVVNRGCSGYNTEQALQVLPQIVPHPDHAKVKLMTVFFGANDARLPDTPSGPQQHVSLQNYRSNLRTILTHPAILAHHDIRLVLITPPPVEERVAFAHIETKYGLQDPILNRLAKTTAQYAQVAREVASELGIATLDLWRAMIERAGGRIDDEAVLGSRQAPASAVLQGFVTDGLHLSGAGYQIMFEEFMKLVESTWPELSPDGTKFVLPAWDSDSWSKQ